MKVLISKSDTKAIYEFSQGTARRIVAYETPEDFVGDYDFEANAGRDYAEWLVWLEGET